MMPSVLTPLQRRKRTSPRIGEVIGQCKTCLDLFSVTILRSGEHLYVEETSRLQWKQVHAHQFELRHRPDCCNGKVRLYYGNAERLLQDAPLASNLLVPATDGASSAWQTAPRL